VSLVGSGSPLAALTKQVLETALEAELDEHLGYEHGDRDAKLVDGTGNERNGARAKTVHTELGPVSIEVPRDRDGSFGPLVVRKRQRRLSEVDEMVLSLSAKGLTTGEIAAFFDETYGQLLSRDTISRITDKVIEEMVEWRNRPLDIVYPVVFDDQKDWLSVRKAGLTTVRSGRADLNLTEVVRVSAENAFADARLREAVDRLWRELSADAHVPGWSVFQRSSFGKPDRRTGIGEGRAPGSPGHLAEAFLPPYRMLKHGWSLFDRRCEQPIRT
jgi:hypothetical protein